MTAPLWLTLAHEEMGVEEVAGKDEANPRIMEYFGAASGSEWVKDDSTPWCGAFCSYIMSTAGHGMPREPLRARSWLTWGQPIDKPLPGCVVVLKRGSSPQSGHVGFWVQRGKNGTFYLLGGNQGSGGKVSIAKFKESDVLGYRWPSSLAPKPPEPEKSRIVASGDATAAQGAVLSAGGIGAGLAGSGPSPSVAPAPPSVPSPPDLPQITEWQYFASTLKEFVAFAVDSWIWIAAAIGVYLILTGKLATWARKEDAASGKTWEGA